MSVLDDSILASADAARERLRPGSEALWRMTAEQRVAAMWAGELNQYQLYEWAKRAPDEVPKIDDEFAFIALFTPEIADVEHDRSR